MAKTLEQILKGVKDSTSTPLTTGKDPGVDYADKSKDIRDLLAKSNIEKFKDRVGNGEDVYQASKIKKAELKKGEKPAASVTKEEK